MKKRARGVVKFSILILAILVLLYFFNSTEFGRSLKSTEGRVAANEKISAFVDSFGTLGPVIYIIVYALLTIALFPGVIVTFVGAVLFGTLKGTVFTVIGATIGACGSFLIARVLGREFVERILKGRFKKMDNKIEENGFRAILILRLIPIVPYNVLNFSSGLTKLKFKEYFWATLLGIIPGTFIYTYLFATFGERVLMGTLALKEVITPQFIAPVALFILLIIIPLFLKKSKKVPLPQ